jgi:hypothetical protein
MRSSVASVQRRVCCAGCGRSVEAHSVRVLDLCGPVYICSHCPNPDMWRGHQEQTAVQENRWPQSGSGTVGGWRFQSGDEPRGEALL